MTFKNLFNLPLATPILLFLLSLISAQAEQEDLYKITFTNAKIIIPFNDISPVIDGKLSPGEWEDAQECNGFSGNERTLIAGKAGSVRICRNNEFLFFAILTSTPTNDPGGALKTSVVQRDGAVFSDDSVEIIIYTDPDKKIGYQFVFNAHNTIFDQKYTRSPKQSQVDWNCKNLTVASTTEEGWWVLEVAIPLSEIGDPKNSLLFNVARNWSDMGYSTLNYTPDYFLPDNMLRGDFENNIAIVKELEFGAPEFGNWNIRLGAKNIGEKKLRLTAQLWHYDTEGKVCDAVQIEKILPRENKEIHISAKITTSLYHLCTMQLKDIESGQVYYARCVMGRKGSSTRRRPASFSFDCPDIKTSGVAYFYPGYNKLSVELDQKPQPKLMLSVSNNKKAPFEQAGKYWRAVTPVSPSQGLHNVLLLSNGKKYPIGKIEKKKYVWEGRELGCEKIILPPFKPLESDGNEVRGTLNDRKINSMGLYDSVKNRGHELLAAPMCFLLKTNDNEELWMPGEKPIFKLNDGGYAAEAYGRSKSASGIELSFQSRIDYDGFNWLNFRLERLKQHTIQQLTLVIKFCADETPFFHAVANTIRPNPAGALPDHWTGSQLIRKKHFGEEVMHPQLVPYLWLGGEERGLSWFIDSSFGFKLNRDKDAVRIFRKDDVVIAELDIINIPTSFTSEKLEFSFGFHPTPVKPLTQDLRNTLYDMHGAAPTAMNNAQFIYGDYLGGFFPWGLAPFNNEYTMWRDIMKALTRGEKLNYKKEWEQWDQQYWEDFSQVLNSTAGNTEYAANFRKRRDGFVHGNLGHHQRRPSLPYIYLDPRLAFKWYEEVQYFRSEWWNPAAQNYFGTWRIFPTSSYRDYFLHCMDLALKNGLHGIYLDDVYIMPDNNPDTEAIVDEQGEVHSRIGILALRDLIKRLAVLQHQHNKYPRILQVHMTDALLVPCFSFATSQLGFEAKYGETPLPTRYSLDYIRTIGLGRKIGANGLMLQGIRQKSTPPEQWKDTVKTLKRSMLALSLPHDIRQFASHSPDLYAIYQKLSDFGCFREDRLFIPYWEKNQTLKVNNENVLLSYYQRSDALLIILSNYFNAEAVDVEISSTLLRKIPLRDYESGKEADAKKIVIPGYDFRLLFMTIDTKISPL